MLGSFRDRKSVRQFCDALAISLIVYRGKKQLRLDQRNLLQRLFMTELKEKTQNALDEGRTLILGAQILLGALFRVVFEPGYHELPAASRYLVLWALGLITVVVALLMAPAPYHRIVEGGQDDEEFNSYVMRIMTIALLPFALSTGLSIYIFIAKAVGPVYGICAGAGVTLAALFLWYGLRLLPRDAYKK
jgi:hypothetical protein